MCELISHLIKHSHSERLVHAVIQFVAFAVCILIRPYGSTSILILCLFLCSFLVCLILVESYLFSALRPWSFGFKSDGAHELFRDEMMRCYKQYRQYQVAFRLYR